MALEMETLAPFMGVTDHLAAQWLVPALVGPLMIAAHVACLAALLGSRTLSVKTD